MESSLTKAWSTLSKNYPGTIFIKKEGRRYLAQFKILNISRAVYHSPSFCRLLLAFYLFFPCFHSLYCPFISPNSPLRFRGMFTVEAIRDHFLFFPQCSFNSYSLHPLDFRYHLNPSLDFTFIPNIFSCDSTNRAHCLLLSSSHCFSLQITASVIPSFHFIIKILLVPNCFLYLLS